MNKKQLFLLSIFYTSLFFNLQAAKAEYPILSYEEYAILEHTSPYTYTFSKENQHLFYFGANHSCDPKNEQYPQLELFWKQFLDATQKKECIVLIEGNLRKRCASKEEAITSAGGEGGIITFFSHQENIPVICPEPNKEELKTLLLKTFSEDEINYRDFAHRIQQFNRYKQVNPNLSFDAFYKQYEEGSPIEKMKALHQIFFNSPFDPNDEDFFYKITNPVTTETVINHVCREASRIRDQQIVDQINTLLKQNKNIFIIYGETHAVMQEQAIRTCFFN
jgi:hypothetical protein